MHRIPSAFAPAIFIPGLVYEWLVRARVRLYSAALLPINRLPAAVISIGNITMGGTGKTPLVIYIARMLSTLGHVPAVLTRGYGRNRPRETHIIAPEDAVSSPAWILGDEPALIRRLVPSAWMGVSKNRFAAGILLAKRNSQVVFVLDDGFQHCKLHRNLDIVVIDSSRPLGSDRVFPRGMLREPISALRRCDVIVINGLDDSPESGSIETEIRKLRIDVPIFHCHQSIQFLTPFLSWRQASSCSREAFSQNGYRGSRLAGVTPDGSPLAYLVTALGNPERFRRDIQRIGITGSGEKFFSDHHYLSRKDWQNCADNARQNGANVIITTEKDAVKINEPPEFPLLVAEQSIEFADADAFQLVIKKCIEGHA